MFGSLKSYFDQVSTRSGREKMLGLKPNKLLRDLKSKALKEFKEKYPEYEIRYDGGAETLSDYDGYIQYYDSNKQKICFLVEGESRVINQYSSIPKNHLAKYRFSSYRILNLKEEIPIIRDLLGANEVEQTKLDERIKYGMNIVLSNAFIQNLFSSCTESEVIKRKRHLKDALSNMINNNVLPFGSYDELATSSINTQLTAIAVFLYLIKVTKQEDEYEFKEADERIFDILRKKPNFDPIIKSFVGELSSIQTAQCLYYDRRFNSIRMYLEIPTKPLDMQNW